MEKLTATQLLAKIKQTAEDAAAFKAYWQDSFPNDLPLPPEYEIKNAIRRLPLDYLAKGIEAYASKLGKSESPSTPNSKNALNYVCGAAWKMMEQENPDHEFHPTARRERNARRNPDSQHWDGEAFGNASPEERQRIMAETIARQKSAKGVQ